MDAMSAPPPPAPPATMPASTPPTVPATRPTGVTVLAVLNAIIGVFALIAALGAFAIGGMVGATSDMGIWGALGAIAGVLFLAGAVIYLASAWGLWTRQRWAWYLAMIGVVLGILNGIVSFPAGILGIILSAFIGWYLLSPRVQAWFGTSHNVPWKYSSTM